MDTQSLIERAEADLQRIEDVEGNYYDLANVRGALAIAASQAAEIARLREALEWYGEQARLCRLITSEGDKGRHALDADGGKRAHAALNGAKP